jgi:hypothetical protein
MLTTPSANVTWKDKVAVAFENLPPEELQSIEWCLRHALELIDGIYAKRAGGEQS